MKAYLSTFSDAAEAKGKPLQPQQCCENYISFPVSDRTFSFGARLTPLNLASLEKRKKQRFNGFCHSPFQLFHVKQFLEKRKQNVSRETFLGWIKGVRKRETAPAAKAVPVRRKGFI